MARVARGKEEKQTGSKGGKGRSKVTTEREEMRREWRLKERILLVEKREQMKGQGRAKTRERTRKEVRRKERAGGIPTEK